MPPRVLVVGAGLAGLGSAVALAGQGLAVEIIEARPRLGGRASSFPDAGSGLLVDNCQHVSMGCCTNLAHFTRLVGINRYLQAQPELFFRTPDRRTSTFRADPLPAPLHLGRAFARAHFLSPRDKLTLGWGLAALKASSPTHEEAFLPWLRRHHQTEQAIRRFWNLVLVSALNEEIEQVGFRYARKVFVDGFLRHPRGFQVEIPTVPLGRLYGDELQSWLDQHGVRVTLAQGARQLLIEGGRVGGLLLRDGNRLTADWYIAALPWHRLLEILPESFENEPVFRRLRQLQPSPITSIHCWFDRPITTLPHVVLVDALGQWLFNRGEVAPGEHYVQVVISAARALADLGREEIQRRVVAELRQLFPEAEPASLLRCRVVTEHQATFSAVPGVDRLRPTQQSPIPNLVLAGDWTATGWPATMEGAVRSGYLAAGAVCRGLGQPRDFVQADLGS
jgi:squalene-associated FAD-dependent desaturase